jgi:acyl-CoA thioester hydrolase
MSAPAPFRHAHRVVYAECTVGDHIYYARYLDLFEEARGELFRTAGRSFREWQEQGLIFPVVEAHLSYAAPARYDELLAIDVTVSVIGRIRLQFDYRISGPGSAPRVQGRTLHVCADLHDKPRRLPPELLDVLAPWRLDPAHP